MLRNAVNIHPPSVMYNEETMSIQSRLPQGSLNFTIEIYVANCRIAKVVMLYSNSFWKRFLLLPLHQVLQKVSLVLMLQED